MVNAFAMVLAVPIGLAWIAVLAAGRGERRGRTGGHAHRIRVGPGLPALAMRAALRRLDTMVLAAATATVVVALVLNARA